MLYLGMKHTVYFDCVKCITENKTGDLNMLAVKICKKVYYKNGQICSFLGILKVPFSRLSKVGHPL